MRCPKCHTETPSDALVCPGCKLATPKGRQFQADKRAGKNPKSPKRVKEAKAFKRSRALNIVLGCVIGSMVVGLGIYVYETFLSGGMELDAKAAGQMLITLRRMPSNEKGLSVDERMNEEIKKSKESGKLLKYQGWTTRPIRGERSKILIAFSFEEKESGEQRAEWIADPSNNSFAPRTGLAWAVYGANNDKQ